jgi:hypothetical protein
MEKVHAELSTLKKQGDKLQKQCAVTTSTLKATNETLRGLNNWVPHVDESIKGTQKTLDTIEQ